MLEEISLVTVKTKCYHSMASINHSCKYLCTKSYYSPKLLCLPDRKCSQHVTARVESENNTEMKIKSASEILSSLDAETEKKLKVIKLEYEVLLHMGAFVCSLTDL